MQPPLLKEFFITCLRVVILKLTAAPMYNCFLEPLCDDFSEISYIKKFTTIFNDDTFRNFFSSQLLRQEIIQTFQSKIFSLNKEQPTYEARKKYFERQIEEELDA